MASKENLSYTIMASVDSNHSNGRVFSSSHDSRVREYDDQDFEMRVPLQPSSYENMNNFVDDPSHQYEDPVRFQGDKMPRKKTNDLYEPAKRGKRRRFTDSLSEGSYDNPSQRDPCWLCVRITVFLVFFLALAALALIALIVFGFLPIKGCTSCSAENTEDGRVASVSRSSELWEIVKELRANVSELSETLKEKNNVIEDLQRRDTEQGKKLAELESKQPVFVEDGKLVNVTTLIGRRGPRGYNGSQGAAGARGLAGKRNLSLCRYVVAESLPYTADSGSGQNVEIMEGKGQKIMGVSCSTVGSSEYNLKSNLRSNVRQYECECRGESTLFPQGGANPGKSYCYIHYWTCPI